MGADEQGYYNTQLEIKLKFFPKDDEYETDDTRV